MNENTTEAGGKMGEILRCGVAPGFPQKGRLDPKGVQTKALKGLKAIENEPIYKHGPCRGASRIAKYFGMGDASSIRKTWERPYRKRTRMPVAALCVAVGASLLFGSVRTAEAQYITPGVTLLNGQTVYASTLNQLVADAIIGPGFISSQPINPSPLQSDYILEYSPTLLGLYKITVSNIVNQSSVWLTLNPGIPNINTNDLFQFYSQSAQAAMSITYTNLSLTLSSNLQFQYVNFAPTNENNTGATNAYILPQWLSFSPNQTNNQPQLVAFGTNGIPQQIAMSNLIGNAISTINTDSIPWNFQQIFTPWLVYGTNIASPLTSTPPFTNAFGTNVVIGPIVSVFMTNGPAGRTNVQVLNDSDTIPVNSVSTMYTNDSATMFALFSYITNRIGGVPYTVAREAFGGTPQFDTISNMSSITGIITNNPDALNWSNAPEAISFAGKNSQMPTVPAVQSNVIYWAYCTNVANFLAYQIYTNYANALARVNQILGNGVSSTAQGTNVWVTNFTSFNAGVIQVFNATTTRTGIYDVYFLTPSVTPYYYVWGNIEETAGGNWGGLNIANDNLVTTNFVRITTAEFVGSAAAFPLVHVLIGPQ
jgi:hypothetical protein